MREIEAHAKSAGTTRSDAIRECLAVGLETIRGRDGVPGGRVEEVLGAIESVRLAVELLGPSTLGTQRLLAHWAARDGGVKVSEDELLAEVRSVGADEWEQAVAEAERNLPGPRTRRRKGRGADMFFVEARYHRDPRRAAGQVRYIAHREEGLTDGRRRELYGIGERYRALRGDEPAIRKALREDGRGLRNPAYFRFILTVDNPTAQRFQRLDGFLSERVLRDAVEKTFRGAARGAQGVFAVHQHGGQDRPAHPHVHAVLSPRFENRMAVHISPVRIQRIKERWEREVLAGLQRQERRLDRARDALARVSVPDQRERDRAAASSRAATSGDVTPGRPTGAVPGHQATRAACPGQRLGAAVASVRTARRQVAASAGEGGAASRVSRGDQGHAEADARRDRAVARAPRARPSATIGIRPQVLS